MYTQTYERVSPQARWESILHAAIDFFPASTHAGLEERLHALDGQPLSVAMLPPLSIKVHSSADQSRDGIRSDTITDSVIAGEAANDESSKSEQDGTTSSNADQQARYSNELVCPCLYPSLALITGFIVCSYMHAH